MMAKSSHDGDGDFTQNQNNSMSDDPGDGGRKSFTAGGGKQDKAPGAPDNQGKERLQELGNKGAEH